MRDFLKCAKNLVGEILRDSARENAMFCRRGFFYNRLAKDEIFEKGPGKSMRDFDITMLRDIGKRSWADGRFKKTVTRKLCCRRGSLS